MIPAEIIRKKRDGLDLTEAEIGFFINGYTDSEIPDYQMAALLMAIVLKGMTSQETAFLTEIMLNSGERLTFDKSFFAVDKHSTGGVGDKTSLILAPIVAACGVPVPMMSGRGLGHSGGTVDKLESIPGFTTEIPLPRFRELVMKNNIAMVGQSTEICPADKKIYGLRDVTGTVESLPLICASIMSKKIAEGIRGLVLDVKCGSGAFMKTYGDAVELANGLMNVGRAHNLNIRTLITNMHQPLGAFVGNALEIAESIAILKNTSCLDAPSAEFADCRELSLELAANMLMVADDSLNELSARERVLRALDSGRAWEVFEKMCVDQGGRIQELPQSSTTFAVTANKSGYVAAMNTEKIGFACIELGAGRKKTEDVIDPVAGLRVHRKIGHPIHKGDPLFTVYLGKNDFAAESVKMMLEAAVEISDAPQTKEPLIFDRLHI